MLFQVKILVNVTEKTKNITLHAVDLKIDEKATSVNEYNPTNRTKLLKIENQRNDTARQFFIIKTTEYLKPGKQYIVYLKFIGYLNDFLQGFYRSSYKVDNQTRFVLYFSLL